MHIPASGFYEWTGEKKDRVPHLFTAADGGAPVIAFAGLWDTWLNPETNETVTSCTMIVSGASEWMMEYRDRIPFYKDGSVAKIRSHRRDIAARSTFELQIRFWPRAAPILTFARA